MSIEEAVLKIKKLFSECGYEWLSPASDEEINQIKRDFISQNQFQLPEAYCQILSISNGIKFNGLTIWPTKSYGYFHESLLEANENLKGSFNNNFIYFGILDEELYVYDKIDCVYKALEFVGQAEWNLFLDAESMFIFIFQRVVESLGG